MRRPFLFGAELLDRSSARGAQRPKGGDKRHAGILNAQFAQPLERRFHMRNFGGARADHGPIGSLLAGPAFAFFWLPFGQVIGPFGVTARAKPTTRAGG